MSGYIRGTFAGHLPDICRTLPDMTFALFRQKKHLQVSFFSNVSSYLNLPITYLQKT